MPTNTPSPKPFLYVEPTEIPTRFFSKLPVQEVDIVPLTGLPCDYVVDGIRGIVTIERKTINDFSSSIIDGRLFRQLKSTVEYFPDSQHLYLVYGYWRGAGKWGGPNMPTLMSAMNSLTVDWKANVVCFTRDTDAAMYLTSLVKRIGKPKDGASTFTLPKPTFHNPRQQAMWFLSSLPHIGSGIAEELLNTHGTPLDVINLIASDKQGKVKGLTPDRLADIRRVLLFRSDVGNQ